MGKLLRCRALATTDRVDVEAALHDATLVVDRAVRLATEGTVAAVDGSTLRVDAGTISVHGDTPGADQLAARIRSGLEAAGVRVQAIGDR